MTKLLPDGIIDISIKTLQTMNLLLDPEKPSSLFSDMTVIEHPTRITVFDDRFVIWIVPQQHVISPTTLVYIASQQKSSKLQPELCFRTRGIHNRSKTIANVIDYFLQEIAETNMLVSQLH